MKFSSLKAGYHIFFKYFFLFALAIVVAAAGCQQNNNSQQKQPLVKNGVLDLRNWNLAEDGPVKLDGEWEFYWHELLEPHQICAKKHAEKTYLNLPRSWNGFSYQGEKLPGRGYATFRAVIKTDLGEDPVKMLKIPYMSTAYKLWVNGQLVATNGRVGSTPDTMVPHYLPQEATIVQGIDDIELVIQVANFMHRRGGIWKSIYLGTEQQIHHMLVRNIGANMFILGSILAIGIYALTLYLFRRKEVINLYFGSFCLLLALRSTLVGEMLLVKWFPFLEWEFTLKLEYFTYYLGLSLFLLLIYNFFPAEMPLFIVKAGQAAGYSFAGLVLFTKAQIYTHLNFIFQIITVAAGAYTIVVLLQAVRRKREGAAVITVGALVFISTIYHDILYYNELTTGSDLAPFGLLVFIFSQSVILAMRFSKAFVQTQQLARENAAVYEKIKDLNRNLEDKILERTAELNATIGKLHREIMERKNAEKKLKTYATTDVMTGTLNRATGLALLRKQLALAERQRWHLTVCFMDIDNLKEVNDKLGHQAGDKLIVTIIRILRECLRETDTICRLGGDEFLIIFPQCAREQAAAIWGRVAAKFKEYNTACSGKFTLSVSHGFATLVPGHGQTMDQLIEQADREMYRVKKAIKSSADDFMVFE